MINFELKDLTFEEHVKISIKAKKIVFCLPPNPGIGDSIEYGLAIKSIKENNLFEKIGIAFCSNTYKILSKFVEPDNIYSDFITDDEINQYDALFHFTTEIDSLKFQKYERENIEKCVNNYFNIKKYHPKKDILSKKISRVSIFPISKSPIRTLSVTLIEDITSYLLKRNFVVDLILGNDELTSKKYLQIFDSKKINIYNPVNVQKLDSYIKNIEFGIFCDSGPVHLSKIYKKKGFLIATSVNSKNILNEDNTIISYNSEFKSLYCNAPCGLTNIINLQNKHGCYNTLKKNKDFVLNNSNFRLFNRGDLQKSYKKYIDNPVGCVESIKFKKIKIFLDQLLK